MPRIPCAARAGKCSTTEPPSSNAAARGARRACANLATAPASARSSGVKSGINGPSSLAIRLAGRDVLDGVGGVVYTG